MFNLQSPLRASPSSCACLLGVSVPGFSYCPRIGPGVDSPATTSVICTSVHATPRSRHPTCSQGLRLHIISLSECECSNYFSSSFVSIISFFPSCGSLAKVLAACISHRRSLPVLHRPLIYLPYSLENPYSLPTCQAKIQGLAILVQQGTAVAALAPHACISMSQRAWSFPQLRALYPVSHQFRHTTIHDSTFASPAPPNPLRTKATDSTRRSACRSHPSGFSTTRISPPLHAYRYSTCSIVTQYTHWPRTPPNTQTDYLLRRATKTLTDTDRTSQRRA